MLARIAMMALLLACGGAQRGGDDVPACEAVAQHLLDLANTDNLAEAEPGVAEGMRAEFARQCRDDAWSTARRRCIAKARSQDATLRCPER